MAEMKSICRECASHLERPQDLNPIGQSTPGVCHSCGAIEMVEHGQVGSRFLAVTEAQVLEAYENRKPSERELLANAVTLLRKILADNTEATDAGDRSPLDESAVVAFLARYEKAVR